MKSMLCGACLLSIAMLFGDAPRARGQSRQPSDLPAYVPTAEQIAQTGPPQQGGGGGGGRGRFFGPVEGLYKASISPQWLADGRFWYRNDLAGGEREFVLVDPGAGTRAAAFDHAAVAAALAKATGEEVNAKQLAVDGIAAGDAAGSLAFTALGGRWSWTAAGGKLERTGDAPAEDGNNRQRQGRRRGGFGGGGGRDPRIEEITPETIADGTNLAYDPPLYEDAPSPDHKWTAAIADSNIVLKSAVGDENAPRKLTADGVAGHGYGMLEWSPDSKWLIASRVKPVEAKKVYLLRSSPRGGGRAELTERLYPLPGDPYTTYELFAFNIEKALSTNGAGSAGVKLDASIIDFYGPAKLHWREDNQRFLYHQTDRGHGRFRIYEADAATGKVRTLFDDDPETFVSTTYDSFIYYCTGNSQVLYASERDGWKHIYRIDADSGEASQLTKGEWVMRGVDRVDEDAKQIWFRASGLKPEQDPYFIHYCRVDFDGKNFTVLTEGDGTHNVQYSPDRKWLVDTWSRVDLPPQHALRKVSDGSLVCELEKADASGLIAAGWTPPEIIVAKGRDGKTDIWGVLERPKNFDPTKRYPVIESIYAGPHSSYTPKAFAGRALFSSLTDLGFVVVQMDGMGTSNRSKAFHDVCFQDLADAGFPDRILWHQEVAKKYPWYDISRMGIYGGSAGGQNSAGAVLFQPDFYDVAVSACGCHDNRMDKASWNEQWMGYPVGPEYAASSNVEHAAGLRGKLLLIVGELDSNVPPETSYRLCDALIRAGKQFEFILAPNEGHGSGGAYGGQRRREFFVRHLHGVQTPDWNAAGN
jgi:dipeptidyl aminopeptidase/acylaminoacyl peptidase